MKLVYLVALLVLTAAPFAGAADVIHTENPDAGESPGTAQPALGPATAQEGDNLTQIRGSISSGTDADVFKIFICDPANFSATTVGGASFDTQLFLFMADGTGIFGNDDTDKDNKGLPGSVTNQSFLPGFTAGTAPFCALIGISGFNTDPRSGPNGNGTPIFNNAAGNKNGPFTPVFTPKNNAGPLTGFNANSHFNFGDYTIFLTGVCIDLNGNCEIDEGPGPGTAPIPEPASMALLGIGVACCALRRRMR
jgi:hypothetical protein